MSRPDKGHSPQTRLRGPNIATVIAAAAAAGRQLVGAVSKPGGVIELKFSEGDSGNEPGRNLIEA
jgi:hypothetical protein